ncbi:MAG: NAD(P)-dependent glycerol-3-phosphate dehydrogenase [Rhodoferax sp.]|nr:NAD(P)-dependent glycerol-3-phosphate dehydrogenase [Rhodoferax sp.]
MKIVVLGAGSWGTALAVSACRNPLAQHAVTLWMRDAAQAWVLKQQRENTRYLPGIALPPNLDISAAPLSTLAATLAGYDLTIIATPMAGLRGMLTTLQTSATPVVWLCKGFEAEVDGAPGLLGHEIQVQVAPKLRAGVFSGPSFAQEVALGQPTALAASSMHAEVRATLVEAFHSPTLRVYDNDDLVGVEVGGAVKNVMAIACGLCDGLHLGLNARAALITRGLAEITRLGLALGARVETFMGLSGMGDLVLTATGDLSRNRRVGLALAQGKTLEQTVAALGHVAEGVYSAHTVVRRAHSLGVDMPIAQGVVDLLDGHMHPSQALTNLMAREPGSES